MKATPETVVLIETLAKRLTERITRLRDNGVANDPRNVDKAVWAALCELRDVVCEAAAVFAPEPVAAKPAPVPSPKPMAKPAPKPVAKPTAKRRR